MIKKIKKLFYTIQIAIYEYQAKKIAKEYWREMKNGKWLSYI